MEQKHCYSCGSESSSSSGSNTLSEGEEMSPVVHIKVSADDGHNSDSESVLEEEDDDDNDTPTMDEESEDEDEKVNPLKHCMCEVCAHVKDKLAVRTTRLNVACQ